MNNEKMIEEIVKEVMMSMGGNIEEKVESKSDSKNLNSDINPNRDYPLAKKRPELVKTPTDKKLDDITLGGVLEGKINANDVRIAPETLEIQAQVAEGVGRDAFAKNLRRAAELIAVPDDRILAIYNALRPNRSTKSELLEIADELKNEYGAVINSDFVKEAAEVYEKRGMLIKE
ncbi:diol dehydratase small subunit [Clostridiisalibacter paucivorans]|uniref:diol dehydratase small subunit n=1 Tax=Clostridiisalibacter paucivorans TaxID=408753 RepID=UPI00047AA476|nr:diol dehydratase small subunit [Clostridiisalibacter paucivorans]